MVLINIAKRPVLIMQGLQQGKVQFSDKRGTVVKHPPENRRLRPT